MTGWTLLDTAVSGPMKTSLYSKVADATDGGRTVRLALDAAAKYTLTIAVGSGDILAPSTRQGVRDRA